MNISKYIPPQYEAGDLIILTNRNLDQYVDGAWLKKYNETLGIIIEVDWRWERIQVLCFDGTTCSNIFKAFELIGKHSKLVNLLFL